LPLVGTAGGAHRDGGDPHLLQAPLLAKAGQQFDLRNGVVLQDVIEPVAVGGQQLDGG
jgi:hypothetical protein